MTEEKKTALSSIASDYPDSDSDSDEKPAHFSLGSLVQSLRNEEVSKSVDLKKPHSKTPIKLKRPKFNIEQDTEVEKIKDDQPSTKLVQLQSGKAVKIPANIPTTAPVQTDDKTQAKTSICEEQKKHIPSTPQSNEASAEVSSVVASNNLKNVNTCQASQVSHRDILPSSSLVCDPDLMLRKMVQQQEHSETSNTKTDSSGKQKTKDFNLASNIHDPYDLFKNIPSPDASYTSDLNALKVDSAYFSQSSSGSQTSDTRSDSQVNFSFRHELSSLPPMTGSVELFPKIMITPVDGKFHPACPNSTRPYRSSSMPVIAKLGKSSPGEASLSPVNISSNPVEGKSSLAEISPSRVEGKLSPTKIISSLVVEEKSSPVEGKTSPAKIISSLVEEKSSPVKISSSPAKASPSPGKIISSLVEEKSSPVEGKTSPAKIISNSVEANSSPFKISSNPANINSSPAEISSNNSTTPVKTSTSSSDENIPSPSKPKVLPPVPKLEKLNLKTIIETGQKKSPQAIKSPSEARSPGAVISDKTINKRILENDFPVLEENKTKLEAVSKQIANKEIMQMLSKRMGSGLDVSVLAKEKTIQHGATRSLEVLSCTSETSSSVASPSPTHKSSLSTAFQRTLSPEIKQTSPPNKSMKSPPSNAFQLQGQSLKIKPITSPPQTQRVLKSPPPTAYQQQLALAQKQSYQASFSNMVKQMRYDSDPSRTKEASLPVNTEAEPKVPPLKLFGQHRKHTPTEILVDSSSSSVSDALPEDVKASQDSESSHDNNTNESEIDFENVIGSSVVCKDQPQSESSTASEEKREVGSFENIRLHQPAVIIEPLEVVSKKRGRPRKSEQKPMIDPNQTDDEWIKELPITPKGGRAERIKRRDEKKIDLVPPKKLKTEDGEGKGEDDNKEEGDELGKKRFFPRPPHGKRKRRRGAYSIRRKPKEPKKKEEKENFQNFEEETRMSGSGDFATPLKTGLTGDESQGSSVTNAEQKSMKKGRMEVMAEESKPVTVQQIVEYYWPLPTSTGASGVKPDSLMIQEQISEFLGVKSFKRKFPDIPRRTVSMEERNYLQESGFVSEKLCDMGLTIIPSSDVYDIMSNYFPLKFEEYCKYQKEKKAKEQKALREKQALERADIDLRQDALEGAVNFNAELNKAREKRGTYMDLQTMSVHGPIGSFKVIKKKRVGHYPVSLVPSHNTDYYKFYTATEKNYFPMNTVRYGPLKPNERHFEHMTGSDGSQSDSDDSSDSSDSSGSSSSGDTADSDGTGSTAEDDKSVRSKKEDIFDEMFTPKISGRGRGRGRTPKPPPPPKPVRPPPPKGYTYSGKKIGRPPKIKKHAAVKLERIDDVLSDEVKTEGEESEKSKEPGICKMCNEPEEKNKNGEKEEFIQCSHCNGRIHPSCIDLTPHIIPKIKTYKWQCTDCKSCDTCKSSRSEDKLIFCDTCDRGYHIFCVGLKKVPLGNYVCSECLPSNDDPSSSAVVKPKDELMEEMSDPKSDNTEVTNEESTT